MEFKQEIYFRHLWRPNHVVRLIAINHISLYLHDTSGGICLCRCYRIKHPNSKAYKGAIEWVPQLLFKRLYLRISKAEKILREEIACTASME